MLTAFTQIYKDKITVSIVAVTKINFNNFFIKPPPYFLAINIYQTIKKINQDIKYVTIFNFYIHQLYFYLKRVSAGITANTLNIYFAILNATVFVSPAPNESVLLSEESPHEISIV